MKTLTIKLAEELDQRLSQLAAQQGQSKSSFVRAAIEASLAAVDVVKPSSCLDLARDLAGCAEGPEDLSHNKAYLKGYGR